MAFIQKHDHGHFCWLDLGTTDRPAPSSSTPSLRLDARRRPMDAVSNTMFRLKDHDTAPYIS